MKKNIIASFLKFAVYINNHKMLSGNIFGLIFQGQMRIAKIESAYNSLIIGDRDLGW